MFHLRFKNRNYRRLSIKFSCAFLFGTFFSFYLFEKILTFMVAKVSRFPGQYRAFKIETFNFFFVESELEKKLFRATYLRKTTISIDT